MTALSNLSYGFQVALQPSNFLWSFIGVLIGNMVGVLPGMGTLAAISILLPLTYALNPVAAVLLLGGIFYGAQYGGAICSILLNLPCHPSHAVTCIDGYPMTKKGMAGTALGVTVIASFFAASCGIIIMLLFSQQVVNVALKFGAPEYFSAMLLGLLAGGTLSKGSPLKGVAMTVVGLLLGTVGMDIYTGRFRYTFGQLELGDGIQLTALAMGLFGVSEFLRSVNKLKVIHSSARVRARDLWPKLSDLRQSFWPMVRGTLVGIVTGFLPAVGPTISSFISYSIEKKLARKPERFGHGAIEGVVSPEASTHANVQIDFIPTMTLGIPGEAVMALLLSALLIKGITPGPQLMGSHPDIFWGLIASFWVGNVLLVIMNVPLIGLWVKLLAVPYRLLYPTALFFICIGVWSTNDSLFDVGETLFFGVVGYILIALQFEFAPVLLGLVLEPLVEENFRRAMLLSHGDLRTFIDRPISALFIGLCVLLILGQIFGRLWSRARRTPVATEVPAE